MEYIVMEEKVIEVPLNETEAPAAANVTATEEPKEDAPDGKVETDGTADEGSKSDEVEEDTDDNGSNEEESSGADEADKGGKEEEDSSGTKGEEKDTEAGTAGEEAKEVRQRRRCRMWVGPYAKNERC